MLGYKHFIQPWLPVCLIVICSLPTLSGADTPTLSELAKYSDRLPGYLSPAELPNSQRLLPPPPADASAELALDQQKTAEAKLLSGSARQTLARLDANLAFPAAAQIYSCTVNKALTATAAPHLYTLFRRSIADLSTATKAAKDFYRRPRPFMVTDITLCTPEDQTALEKSGSYPSGHTTIGWGWALLMAELDPVNTTKILKRGLAYGDSRIICGAHWQSDVTQGRNLAAGVVAALHASREFQADFEAAKAEFQAISTHEDPANCQLENTALGVRP